MSPRGLIEFAIVAEAPGTSICVNVVGWREPLAAFTAGESQKQLSTSRTVVSVMFRFFICNFLSVLVAFFASHRAACVHALACLRRAREKLFPAVR